MNAPFPPPSKPHDMSPVSVGSEWSGVNNYNSGGHSDSSYFAHARGDGISPPESNTSNGQHPYRTNGFGPAPPEPFQQRRPSESGSRGSSRAGSIANSRSSDGTISDQQSRKYRRMEMELSQHYAVLRSYLKGGSQQPPRPNKARDKLLRLSPVQFHELSTDVFDELQRRQASAPLPGRPPRRDKVPPCLQPRPDFHEKRNQARQKLSSLQTPRFKDLSTDVFCELERRFPHFARPDGVNRDSGRPQSRGPAARVPGGPPGPNGYVPPPRSHSQGQSISHGQGQPTAKGPSGGVHQYENTQNGADYGRPVPRQFQSNTITPNKSTVVEDEDEIHGVDSRYDRSSDAFGLESSLTSPRSDRDTSATSQSTGSKNGQLQLTELQDELAELKAALKAKDDELQQMQTREQSFAANPELERKLREAEGKNNSLLDELNRVQALQAGRRPDEQLERENHSLQEQLKQQHDIIDDVRRQGQLYLEEMRAMAESGGGNFEREDKLQADVQRLEDEIKEWKAKYVRAKTQLRTVRASTLGLSVSRPDVNRSAQDDALYHEDGAVKDIHVTKFQIVIDELLQIARSGEPNAVLDHMKTVVLAVRNITTDIDNASAVDGDEEILKKRSKLKSKVSATANNVITASKNYAAAGGLSPVSLLDAAASHLTAAVVDLVKTVKIKPTAAGELEDDDKGTLEPLQSNGYFNIAESLRRRSAVESVYSALSSPDEGNGALHPGPSGRSRSGSAYTNGSGSRNGLGIEQGFGLRQDDSDLEDLKIYIEDQSDQLVESIQILIEAIRGEESMANIRSTISRITDSVDSVVTTTEKASHEHSSFQAVWREQTGPVTQNLRECKRKLLNASGESEAYDGQPPAKDFIQRLPPLAFQVARETRELVRRIQGIKTGEGDDDFS